jgi:hypothetical protein
MRTKADLIADLDRARATMRTLLDDLEVAHRERQEVYPTWTIKELLAHLTGWDDACIASLQTYARDEAPATPASLGINPYNASTVHERQALSLEQVLKEWEATREVFKQAIRDLPEEKVAQPFVMPWGETGDLAGMVDIFAGHELEHAIEIREKMLGANP